VSHGADRSVIVDGLSNARDLGGLRRSNGTLTPSGAFFRSESLDRVTAKGWEQLREHGIRSIVDLRRPDERAELPSRPSWVTTFEVDLDGLDNQLFWADYWENGLVGTAMYFVPHLEAMPERSGAALSAMVTAPPGGVLFHCGGGRDRTGLIAMLLLLAVGTEPDAIVADYMETISRRDAWATATGRSNVEPELEALCQRHGTTTEGAFRSALAEFNLDEVLTRSGLDATELEALHSWRGSISIGSI
jgi:protein-tyrosine phosphatase